MGEVEACCSSLHRRIGSQNHFRYLFPVNPLYQFPDFEVVRTNAFQRGYCSMQYVISPGKGPRVFNGHQIIGVLNDTKHFLVSTVIMAYRAGILIRQIKTDGTEMD